MDVERELEMLEEIAVKKLEGVAAMHGIIQDYRNILIAVDIPMRAIDRVYKALHQAHERLAQKY